MAARRIEITVSEEMWSEIEAARHDMPRAEWIKRALRVALDSGAPEGGGDAGLTLAEFRAELLRVIEKTKPPPASGR